MAGFAEFLGALDDLKGDVASFRRVVLHAHSPDSYDYGSPRVGGKVGTVPAVDRRVAESAFSEGMDSIALDMMAITDHMKCGLACRLSESRSSNDVVILPGMEINFRPLPPLNTWRIHILAIFPEGSSPELVCKVLPPPMLDEARRSGNEEIEDEDLPDFVARIHKCGGICIAAHVDTDKGVRRAFRQLGRDGIVLCSPDGELTAEEERQFSDEFKDWILGADFDAIEVAREEHREHYRWVSDIRGRKVSIPVLLTNDAHSIEAVAERERITHIKMASVCFDGLKKALQFPDTRIRFPIDVPKPPSPRILGLEIKAGDEKGFFQELRVAFSDNLTCLIGPRGSGKSTIIEALRYVFGYNRTLDQIEEPGTDLAKKTRSLQKATLTNCVIRVAYCAGDAEPHILEATYDPKQDYATRVYTKDGEERTIHDVEATGEYPLRLFGWSEIETLGREAHRQRELLDKLIAGLSGKLEKRREARSKLVETRRTLESSLSSLSALFESNRGEIRRYMEYSADFEQLNTTEVKELFAGLDTANRKKALLSKLKDNAESWVGTLEKTAAINLFAGTNELLTDSSERLQSWWTQKRDEMKLADTQSEVRNSAEKGGQALAHLVHEVDIACGKVEEEAQEMDRAIREKVSEEAAKQVAVELRRTAGERLQRVKRLRQAYNDETKRFQSCLEAWKQIARQLSKLQDEIGSQRARQKEEIEARLNRLGSEEMTVSIRFGAGRDRREFESHMRESGFLTRDLHGNYKANYWPEAISAACTPVELAMGILERDPTRLVRSVELGDGQEFGIDRRMAQRLVDTRYPFGHDEDADVPTIDGEKLEMVWSVAEVEWDDLEGILLNGKQVEFLSPGQRSSAMLPLIALTGTAPLVIDQPEDNLDNRLVGRMLVDILADLKEQRQIIVATHNPNIVVSGDAEQVIVLEALSHCKGRYTQAGSIDTKEIVDSVVDIMEGGKEAFLTRQRRYQLH